MEHVGFPWVEIAEDGSSVIGKHDGTGGEVSIGTVTSQLLYEIASPAYLGPDVTARFDTIRLEQVARDRVRISGTKGEPPPAHAEGRDERARRLPQGPHRRPHRDSTSRRRRDSSKRPSGVACPFEPDDFDQRHDALDPHRQARPGHQRRGGRPVAPHAEGPRRAPRSGGPSPTPSSSSRSRPSRDSSWSAGPRRAGRPSASTGRPSCPPALVPQYVTVLGAETTVVDSVAPDGLVEVEGDAGPEVSAPVGPTTQVPLGQLVRSALGRQGRQRQPRRLRTKPRRLGVARQLTSPSTNCAVSCPRPRSSPSTATDCRRFGRSTS